MGFAGEYMQGKRFQEKLVREFRISYEDGRECVTVSCSVVPDSVLPSRLFCPWNSPGKNTGVGCHSLLQGIELLSPALAGRFFTAEPPGQPSFLMATGEISFRVSDGLNMDHVPQRPWGSVTLSSMYHNSMLYRGLHQDRRFSDLTSSLNAVS